MVIFRNYLFAIFIWKVERERQDLPIHWFTPQMSVTAEAYRWGWTHELGTQPGLPPAWQEPSSFSHCLISARIYIKQEARIRNIAETQIQALQDGMWIYQKNAFTTMPNICSHTLRFKKFLFLMLWIFFPIQQKEI